LLHFGIINFFYSDINCKYNKNKNNVYRVNYDWTDGERLKMKIYSYNGVKIENSFIKVVSDLTVFIPIGIEICARHIFMYNFTPWS